MNTERKQELKENKRRGKVREGEKKQGKDQQKREK
jgi:hypothetical protein